MVLRRRYYTRVTTGVNSPARHNFFHFGSLEAAGPAQRGIMSGLAPRFCGNYVYPTRFRCPRQPLGARRHDHDLVLSVPVDVAGRQSRAQGVAGPGAVDGGAVHAGGDVQGAAGAEGPEDVGLAGPGAAVGGAGPEAGAQDRLQAPVPVHVGDGDGRPEEVRGVGAGDREVLLVAGDVYAARKVVAPEHDVHLARLLAAVVGPVGQAGGGDDVGDTVAVDVAAAEVEAQGVVLLRPVDAEGLIAFAYGPGPFPRCPPAGASRRRRRRRRRWRPASPYRRRRWSRL